MIKNIYNLCKTFKTLYQKIHDKKNMSLNLIFTAYTEYISTRNLGTCASSLLSIKIINMQKSSKNFQEKLKNDLENDLNNLRNFSLENILATAVWK